MIVRKRYLTIIRRARMASESMAHSADNTFIVRKRYLTIIPRARMTSESIAHEAEGQMGY